MTETLIPPAEVVLRVYGDPAPQGSKRAFVNARTGRAQVVEQQSARIRSWRRDVLEVALAAIASGAPRFESYVELSSEFVFPRPKAHYGSGRNAATLKATAPFWVAETNRGDLDKLLRSTFDALTSSGLIVDDRFIVDMGRTRKRFAGPREQAGALLTLREAIA